MRPNEFRYILDESFRMLERRKGANVLSILIMGLSLLILLVFVLVTLNIATVIGMAGEEMRGYVYIADGVQLERSREIQMRLLRMEGVEEVVFVSREEALESLREALGDDERILDDLEENPLPDAYRVKFRTSHINTESMAGMAAEVSGWDGVEDVRYGKEWLERGERLVRGFYFTDLGLGGIIFLSVVFVISNTVRLTVLQRRRAIDVLKLVGATNAYIRTPFVIEGALQGVVAALLAFGLLALVFVFADRYLPGLVFLDAGLVIGFVVFCALLGALGSFAAIRRFLRI